MSQKVKDKIDEECRYAERDGHSRLSVCDHYNWDRELWMHRHTIIDSIRQRGYNVSVSVKWGVTDIETTKKCL